MLPFIANPPAIIISQTPAYVQDIQGWNGTTWGMSQDDVLKVFPQLRTESPGKMSGSYTLDSVPCDLSFRFTSGKLARINLKYTGTNFRINGHRFFELLKEKYGPPTEKGKLADIGLDSHKWLMPSTQVSISVFSAEPSDEKNWVNINYSQRSDRKDI
jgi:hypothetical protein